MNQNLNSDTLVGLLRDISGTLEAADPMKERILKTLVIYAKEGSGIESEKQVKIAALEAEIAKLREPVSDQKISDVFDLAKNFKGTDCYDDGVVKKTYVMAREILSGKDKS